MNDDEKIEETIKQYSKLGESDKNIDVPSLAVNALKNQKENSVSAKHKRWAYLISVAFPPFGLLFAIRYYLSDKSDAKRVANICVILTIVVFVFYWMMIKLLLVNSGVNLEQIQQIDTQELQDLLQ